MKRRKWLVLTLLVVAAICSLPANAQVTAITANTTLTATQTVVQVNPGAVQIVVTLPSAVGIGGQVFTISKGANLAGTSGNVAINPPSGQTINGSSSSLILNSKFDYVQLFSDGANWVVVSSNPILEPVVANANVTFTNANLTCGAGCTLATSGSGTITPSPAGSNTQVQYNNGGVLAGSADFTFNSGTTRIGFNSNNAILLLYGSGGNLPGNGVLRLPSGGGINSGGIGWQNAANSATIGIFPDTSDRLNYSGPGYISSGFISAATKFTSNSGCTEGTLVGGATAGKFTVGQATACTIIITMGSSTTAPNGWACTAYDQTAVPTTAIRQTASTTTTASLNMQVAANDVVTFACVGY